MALLNSTTENATSALAHQNTQTPLPVSTYRLQFNKRFTFADATRLVPYLCQLGISHCHVSPFLKARQGSSHGYDIVDHNQLNPEIGGPEDFEGFIHALHTHGMGLIADIVPNHMGIMGSDNRWWLDVLENGQASDYAAFFDIDWHPVKKKPQNKILVPVLGDHYGNILEQQELKLVFDAVQGEFSIVYYQHRFPVDPQTYPFILDAHHEQLPQHFAAGDPVFLEYQTLANSFGKLPLCTESSEEKTEERKRDKEIFKIHLAKLCADSPPIRQFISFRVTEINRVADECGELHALLEQQVYRLAYWRVAGDEINYRRFFDTNDLAGLRMEDEKVFDATHQFILALIGEGKIQGLRIDHADGLYDPPAYYQRLNSKIAALLNADTGQELPPFYIVAEKIVAGYEYLSSDWPIHGTTGYEFANMVNGLFIDSEARQVLTRCYVRFIGRRLDFDELVYQAKKLMATTRLASELNVLANQLSKIADASCKTRDYTLNSLRDALTEVIACFPVYRTYINSQTVSKQDGQYIDWAVAQAERRSLAADKTVFGFIHKVLRLEQPGQVPCAILLKFVMKFQQYTAPVMAKGYEDTALYQYNRLISLNEVGGDPRRFGNSANAFHHFNEQRVKKWPHSLLCLSTHDSKHSADLRARINVLSEIPGQWLAAVRRWRELNKAKAHRHSQTVISRNDEYLFYQVLVGTWPLMALTDTVPTEYCNRIGDYLIKAVREAKQNTSWINPNTDYEQAVRQWVRRCLDANLSPLFLADFTAFEQRVRKPGLYNALAQTVLQITSPGLPDIYQGNELWQFALVDPDNRRPVDFCKNGQLLNAMDSLLAQPDVDRSHVIGALLSTMDDGRIKLFVVMQALRLRQHYAVLFGGGDYLKINIHGMNADCLLAFARQDKSHFSLILTPRLTLCLSDNGHDKALAEVWPDTWLELPQTAPTQYQELFTQNRILSRPSETHHQLFVRDVLDKLPIAILSAPR